MTKLLSHLRHNVVAYLALFVALGGTSYAVINLPANSVGTRQLRYGAVTANKIANGSISALKLDHRSIGAFVRFWAVVNPSGQVVSSQPQAQTIGWGGGHGTVHWQGTLPRSGAHGCFSLANADGGFASVLGAGTLVGVQTYNATGQPAAELVDVAVLCMD
jgi:hypothetical protein